MQLLRNGVWSCQCHEWRRDVVVSELGSVTVAWNCSYLLFVWYQWLQIDHPIAQSSSYFGHPLFLPPSQEGHYWDFTDNSCSFIWLSFQGLFPYLKPHHYIVDYLTHVLICRYLLLFNYISHAFVEFGQPGLHHQCFGRLWTTMFTQPNSNSFVWKIPSDFVLPYQFFDWVLLQMCLVINIATFVNFLNLFPFHIV